MPLLKFCKHRSESENSKKKLLAQRGFDWEVISVVAREVLKGGKED
jgi:SOS response regulatory protein OraA/RecX